MDDEPSKAGIMGRVGSCDWLTASMATMAAVALSKVSTWPAVLCQLMGIRA